jgi:hypothetical protein
MKIADLRIGMKVRHPQYGVGMVKVINESTAEIAFDDSRRTIAPEPSGIEPAEPIAAVQGLNVPLHQLVEDAVTRALLAMGVEKPDAIVEQLGSRWHKGKLVMHPADPTLQTKEVPMEIFFHKIVGIRNQLRVLEQKLNGSDKLTDGEKVEWQQYITRCYGSLTTFNLLFQNKQDQFSSKGE